MTIAQFIVAYSVCWWLVLFMLLPYRANPSATPAPGHAPSAPAKPLLKKKCAWATVLALLPTAAIYLAATNARAQETVYHAGGGCHRSSKYTASPDVAVKDGFGRGGKTVAPADLNGGQKFINTDSIDIPLAIPSQDYINRSAQANSTNSGPTTTSRTSVNGRNVDLSQSFIGVGKLTVKQNGDSLLNDQPIANDPLESGECDEKN